MNTGHPSKAALGAARIALMAGVSAAAIFAASSANAQTVDVPGIGSVALPGQLPADNGTNLYVLHDQTGSAITIGTAGASWSGNGTPQGNGAPQVAYSAESNYGGAYQNTIGGAGVVLVDSNGKMVANSTTITGWTNVAGVAAPLGYSWVEANHNDPLATFGKATYADVAATGTYAVSGGALPLGTTGTVSGTLANTDYILNASGQLIGFSAATINAACTAAGTGCHYATPASVNSTADAAITAPQRTAVATADLNVTNTPAATTWSLGPTGAPANQTTSLPGGVVYSNASGQSTAIGPDGINGVGWTLNVSNPGHTSYASIANGVITSTETTGPNQGSTQIDGANTRTVGPNGGTFGTLISNASGTQLVGVGLTSGVAGVAIVNTVTGASNVSNSNGTLVTVPGAGVVGIGGVAGGTIGVGVATATGYAGIGTSTPGGPTGLLVSNSVGTAQFTANSSGYISAEGNRIQDVGTPIVGTDATNKAYVDKGLNKAYEGTAIALAISQPVFLPGQTFAMRGGWGGYEGQNAFGVSAAGVVAHNVFGYGSTVSLDGGIGVGSNNGGVAGKAGVTVGFGGGSAPLK